tara:strand:+ start:278 stop:469 length:192 start_codon:yes stop_codon:yes gene_type:complete
LNTIEITIDVELQKNSRMISRSPGSVRINTFEAHIFKVEPLNKCLNGTNRVILGDEVVQKRRE